MTRTLDDLRNTLDRHAGQTPPAGITLLPAVRGRAAQLKRRRTVLGGAALVAAIAVTAGVAPLMVRTDAPVTATARAWSRTPEQTSVTLRAGSPFLLMGRKSTPTGQYATVRNILDVQSSRPGVEGRNEGADVLVFDPGAFDPARLQQGTPIAIGERRGWFVEDMHAGVPNSGFDGAFVGWQDSGGAWVLLMDRHADTPDDLIEVAKDLRIVDGMDAVSPVTLGWVPPGLRIYRADVDTSRPAGSSASFGLGHAADRKPDLVYFESTRDALPLELQITRSAPKEWSNYQHELEGRAPKKINGADSWYLPRPNSLFGSAASQPAGADMVVRAGECMMLVHVRDRAQITEADLDRMLAGATFGSCTDSSGWKRLLG
ncbi:hypothetical protein [Actinoplanes awajinensis]|uniref:Uncharacterized protein n=1 Tax=Actinoplanes awajinensis subsp. mycoplanecinus TaxID=135947 RepID=A0A0X3V8H0_9ACTN|nr:hypothetical protein [Actinoplanes awajinensis]KUL41139.1 hypothetical protein ADL15_05530 [Actinoplanes awajinensis subsp. mycoplanecinus]